MKTFLDTIKERGFVHQLTDEEGLSALLAGEDVKKQTAYIGFDCTAKSLHVGSLMQIMLLRHWQKAGHTPIILLGGATTKIGDPSGKDESRPKLSAEQIQENMDSLKGVFAKFIDMDNAIIIDNQTWMNGLNLMEFMTEVAPHFSVTRMLNMDSAKIRLDRDNPLSFLEFSYTLFQAYDFVELHRRFNCVLQLGGSDQWGNILTGIELNHRLNQANTFGVTSPLLTTASGLKMGKTQSGAVWLNEDMLSAFDYWQFWRNTDDRDVVRFLKIFTELSLEDISSLVSNSKAETINAAKVVLATEATAMLHGREAAEKAKQTAHDLFHGVGMSENIPTVNVSIGDTVPLVSLIVKAGFADSSSSARKLIQGGGIRINDIKVDNDKAQIVVNDSFKEFKLTAGKKRHVFVSHKS
jgi:tyrosyl-tRNA synthetase